MFPASAIGVAVVHVTVRADGGQTQATFGDRATLSGRGGGTFENLAAWPELGQSAVFALLGTVKRCFSGGVEL